MLKIAHHSIYNHPLPENHRFPMEKYDLIPKKLIEKYEFLLNEYCVSQNKSKIIIKNNNNIIRFDSLCNSKKI